ncbi:MAG: hypothetical protein FD149_810 [Rhodospirillaceae bacterium]|nr:MAG: hypothetical protein FD149_810 [Rhodospirillaceae bacterium]
MVARETRIPVYNSFAVKLFGRQMPVPFFKQKTRQRQPLPGGSQTDQPQPVKDMSVRALRARAVDQRTFLF